MAKATSALHRNASNRNDIVPFNGLPSTLIEEAVLLQRQYRRDQWDADDSEIDLIVERYNTRWDDLADRVRDLPAHDAQRRIVLAAAAARELTREDRGQLSALLIEATLAEVGLHIADFGE